VVVMEVITDIFGNIIEPCKEGDGQRNRVRSDDIVRMGCRDPLKKVVGLRIQLPDFPRFADA
jgi:hypothetical protein